MPLQWRNQIWQSLEEGAGKLILECGYPNLWEEGAGKRGLECACEVHGVPLHLQRNNFTTGTNANPYLLKNKQTRYQANVHKGVRN